jgi:mono/diheme cytochrome c family protein
MQTKHILTLGGSALALGAFIVFSCAAMGNKTAGKADGSKLWAQNCIRCHNARSPNSYSATQWEVTMLHMRVRANLTAEEHEAILAYLKSQE